MNFIGSSIFSTMSGDDGNTSPGLFLTRIITKIRDEKDTKKSSNSKLKAACNKALGKHTPVPTQLPPPGLSTVNTHC